MKKYLAYPYILLFVLFGFSIPLQAQTDTEFWFAVPEVTQWSQIDRPINIVIATGTAAANVVISQPAAGAAMPPITLAIPANTVHKENVTAHIDILECKPAATTLNYGLRIFSDVPINAYYEVIGQGSAPEPSNPEAFTLKGSNALGTSFLIPSQNYVNIYTGVNPASSASFDMVATEDNTSITVTPSAALQGGYAAGAPFSITLNRGQVWSATASSLMAAGQLPGSRISSDKPIAVTVKGDLLNASSIYTGPCSDLTGDQIVPVNLLGTEYIGMNGNLNGPGDQLFITALNNGTQVFRDGNATALATINAGQTYRMPVAATPGQMSTYVRTTGPAAVWQLTGIGCEMGATQLPQIECSGSSSVYYTRTLPFDLYLNLMVQTGGRTNFTINGTPLTAATWTAVPGTANQWFSTRLSFSTAQVPTGSVLTVSNSTDLFHMSVLDGNGGNGTSYSYFSNYNTVLAEASASANDLCTGDSILLHATSVQSGVYQWTGPGGFNSNLQNPVIPGAGTTRTGWYYLTATTVSGNCGSSTDSVYVSVHSRPPADLGQDVSACLDSLTLRPPAVGSAGYLWSTGATTNTLVVRTSDTYWLTVTDNNTGCSSSDTVVVDLGPEIVVDLGSDTTICEYDLPHVLSSPQPAGTNYLWSNGYSDPEMEVTRSGRYWLEVTRSGCRGRDTIDIEVVRTPEVFIGGDRVICASLPERIGTTVAGASYLWSMGAVTSHISVSETGEYWLEVNVRGCKGSDTVYIVAQPDPVVNLGPDDYICKGEELLIDAGGEGVRYQWNTGSTDRILPVTTGGMYYVAVISADSCVGRDSIRLTYLPDPVALLGFDTTVCEETPLLLRPFILNADSLLWSDGSREDVLRVRYGGVYSVTAFNECGAESDTIHIQQIFCDIWVPNAFTPNGDGRNDVFRVLGNTHRAEGFSLSVYNRWGQQFFHTRDRNEGWDGFYNGQEALLGTYIYVVEYALKGKPVLLKGNFHLLR